MPVDLKTAREFVAAHHRHNEPPIGHKFSVGVAEADQLVGVAIIGRPVSRVIQSEGNTLEVIRTATDGTRNANSMLYGAARRAAFALGYASLTGECPVQRIHDSKADRVTDIVHRSVVTENGRAECHRCGRVVGVTRRWDDGRWGWSPWRYDTHRPADPVRCPKCGGPHPFHDPACVVHPDLIQDHTNRTQEES
ncbi:XF1762 family protein [Microbacterium sp. CH-015]|uniref:XF1762 family protein n=1 Tax=Microbacterium sp. CH-015 TaxID=3406734 RepID=UPI003C711E69